LPWCSFSKSPAVHPLPGRPHSSPSQSRICCQRLLTFFCLPAVVIFVVYNHTVFLQHFFSFLSPNLLFACCPYHSVSLLLLLPYSYFRAFFLYFLPLEHDDLFSKFVFFLFLVHLTSPSFNLPRMSFFGRTYALLFCFLFFLSFCGTGSVRLVASLCFFYVESIHLSRSPLWSRQCCSSPYIPNPSCFSSSPASAYQPAAHPFLFIPVGSFSLPGPPGFTSNFFSSPPLF